MLAGDRGLIFRGGGGGGGAYNRMFFFFRLQVSGPINGGGYKWGIYKSEV